MKNTTTQTVENQLVPQLRFKEFKGEWSVNKLGRLGGFKGGGTPSTDNIMYWGGEIPWISSSDVKEGDVINLNITRFVTNKGIEESATKIVPKNSVLFVSRVGVGKLVVSQSELCTSQDFANLILTKDSSFYIAYYFISRNKLLHQYSQGTSIKGFTIGDLKSIPINLPTLPEQEKIATFLSTVDEKIQQLTKKKELLAQYKKGVMQQLFTSPLERGSRGVSIRFKDENGNNYPDWEEKRFSDLYSFHSTNSFSRDKLNYKTGMVYNIHYGDIHTKFKSEFKLNEANIPFVIEGVDLSKVKSDSYCQIGDLVMADASENYADIGKTIELIDLNNQKVLAGLHTFLARPKTNKTANSFFSFLLKSWYMRKQIMIIAQGTKVLSLSTTRVGKLKIKLPVVEEQQKIANYLSALDTKIEAVNKQITQTQAFKKGLLQQLFV